ncbi:FG-GAP repeat protein, partial [Streptomyces sp. NPDC003236]
GTTVARGAGEFSSIGRTIATGDYDGDGDTDLAYGENGEESGSLRFRPGPLTTAPVTTTTLRRYSMGGATRDLATGDFDGDGRDDLAATWQGMEDSSTFITRWDDQAKPAQWYADADRGSSLAAADFDRDGTDDLAVGLVQPNPESETRHCEDRLGGAVLLCRYSLRQARLRLPRHRDGSSRGHLAPHMIGPDKPRNPSPSLRIHTRRKRSHR